MPGHYEIWGGWNDDADHGVEAEFLETVMGSITEARLICKEYQKGNRYAYIRDMNDDGKVVQ